MKIWQHLFPITVMSRVLEVSCSGYYAWADRQPSKRACEDERLKIAIRAAHTQSRRTYGARRLQPQLAADAYPYLASTSCTWSSRPPSTRVSRSLRSSVSSTLSPIATALFVVALNSSGIFSFTRNQRSLCRTK